MKPKHFLSLLLSLIWCPGHSNAQPWANIIPAGRAIDWSQAGIPGGIPSRTNVCTTWYNGSGAPPASVGQTGDYYFRTDAGHATSEYKKSSAGSWSPTGSEFTSDVNQALSSCPSGQVVYLNQGSYYVSGNIIIPSNVTLRGAGANATILNANGSSGAVVVLGEQGVTPPFAQAVSITGGTAAGSTSITVNNAAGITVGKYLVIDQQNDGTTVSIAGSEGSCTWCDGTQSSGNYAQGQIVEVTSVSGTTIGISPPLYVAYTRAPLATPFAASAKYAGVEDLQVYANNTGYGQNFYMGACAYCWISGVEGNYADGDHVEAEWSYRGQIVNSYFSNSYLHTPGSYDSCVNLRDKTTAMLVQNNILERLHAYIIMEWGAAGNVIAYNYTFGAFDKGSPGAVMLAIDFHGAHPQFNLIEGNVTEDVGPDSIWGSAANNTAFRNWLTGTTKACNPLSGRGTVTCAPLGEPGASGVNGWWEFQASRGINIGFLNTNFNSIGNVVGSAQQSALRAYGNPMKMVNQVVAVCGPEPCGPGSRVYDSTAYAYSVGFGEASDDGSSGFDKSGPFSTLFVHGDYSNITAATSWSNGISNTLPASFYLSSRPSWWGNLKYPATGPDVSGGSGPGGHSYGNPAQVCYTGLMKGTDGTGSPLSFNANTCYGGSSVTSAPAPPTNLTAVAK